MEITDEQVVQRIGTLLQKIGALVILIDDQTVQYHEKIKMLEETIAELQGKKAE